MSKTLVLGDLHIREKSIPELNQILEEVFQYKADRIIQLGDFYDSHRPTPLELEFGTHIIRHMKKLYKEVVILSGTGRHDLLNGASVVSYLEHLDVILPGIEYRTEIDGKKCLFGHFMLHESKLSYGSGKYGIKDLKGYDIVILGHLHNPQRLTDKIHHLGSAFYINFNEVLDKNKQIAMIEDGKLNFVPLKTPILMKEAYSLKELSNIHPRTKVCTVIKEWEDYKNWVNELSQFKEKFTEFKVKLEFDKIIVAKSNKNLRQKNLSNIIIDRLKNIDSQEVREELNIEFKKEGLL